ncbi:MAG: hypothetical protein H8E14_05095 [Candidatus Marinimicrobia bacterium]|nr:hypothetical protein [Candidatus Neomarinimicrobiota bacterium]
MNQIRNMKLMEKSHKWIILSVVLALIGKVSGYEGAVNPAVPLLYNGEYPQFHQLTTNPAALFTIQGDEFTLYKVSSFYQNNELIRTYDPGSMNEVDLLFDFSRNIDSKSFVNGGIRYTQTNKFDLFSSLEQDFYTNYFSLIDSTNGNVKYDGPQLWFQYNRKLLSHLILGINLEYGVERGLKNRGTKCESIIRNNISGAGLGFLSKTGNLFIGINGNYINRQFSYESVGVYSSAEVYSFSGFQVYTSESPRRIVEKFEYNSGYEYGFQFWQRNLLNSGFGIGLVTRIFGRDANIKLGSTTRHQPVGYWVREGLTNTFLLNFQPEKGYFSGRFIIENRTYQDWAKAGGFPTIILENDNQQLRWGLATAITGLLNSKFYGSLDVTTTNIDYQEYIEPFGIEEDLQTIQYKLGINTKIGLLSSVSFEYFTGNEDLDFHWDIDAVGYWGTGIRFERQFLFGVLGFRSVIHNTVSDDSGSDNKSNQRLFFELFVRR